MRAAPLIRTALLAGLAEVPLAAAAQAPTSYAPRESVTVTPGARYHAGGIHQFFFGSHYRSLWTTPIRVPVLDLKQFAGGLTPVEKGGGEQTRSLRLKGADGRLYQFRSVAKDPRAVLPPELRDTWAAELLQDQMSSAHPVGPAIVTPLLEAGGVLHTAPILVQMPDDPALGQFRAEFAGLLGFIEERPTALSEEEANIGGASKIKRTAQLFKELDDEPAVRVDDRAFLRARLMDVFMGDWDRHDNQWRWAQVDTGGPPRWMPIPLDRDQVFVRFDGFLLWNVRRTVPQLLDFGSDYNDITGATWNGRDLDRRLLTGLERPVWDSVARVLKAKLTDSAIADAVQHLPPEYRPLDAARLERALKARRDHLEVMEDRYYRLLARQVDVYATDKSDEARVTREADGTTVVTLAHKGQQYFQRRFHPSETQEVRIFLQGGDDQVSVEGKGRGSPTVRVIGGGGDDRFQVTQGSGLHLYDDRGKNQVQGAGINRKSWNWKPDSLKPNELPPRDWGSDTFTLLSASYGYDVQAIIGYGGYTEWYAFRRVPYSTRLNYKLEVATGKLPGGRVTLGLTRQFENSAGFYRLEAVGSNIEILRWYGFGNETTADSNVKFNRVNANALFGGAQLGFRFGKTKRSELSAGPIVRWTNTPLSESHNKVRFIAQDQPYGVGRFGLVGGRALLNLEGRDHPHFAGKGGRLLLVASGYPKLWDAEEAFGRVEGEASFALAPPGSWRPSLNLMAGGVKTWGKLPYFLAATLGGMRTLRGYRPDRFAGDASLYGSAELRVPVLRGTIILPGEQGIFGFADAGRVYLKGESSDTWHSTVGGGIWFSFLTRDNVLYAGVGAPTNGKEGARLVLGFGFPY